MKRKFGTEGEWFAKIIGFLVVAKENHHHGVSLRGDGGRVFSDTAKRAISVSQLEETSEFELFLQPGSFDRTFLISNVSVAKFLTRVFRLFRRNEREISNDRCNSFF